MSSLKSKAKIGLYWSFGNQGISYAIQFIIGIVMARLLSPSDYGITALPAVFMAVANIFIEGGFTNALIRKQNVKDEDLCTSLYYNVLIGFLFYLILFFSSPWISRFYNVPILEDLIRVSSLTFIISPLSVPQKVILTRKLDFKTPTLISIIVKICSGALGIYAAYHNYGVWALVISNVVGCMLDTIFSVIFVGWLPRKPWSRESFSYLWNYGNKLLASGLINTLYKNISPLLIGRFYSSSDLGLFKKAQDYAGLSAHSITQTVRSVSFPLLSKLQDDESLLYNYRRILKTTCFVVFPIMILVSCLANPLVVVLISDKWIQCVPLLQILCFSQIWYPIDAINLNLLQVKGRTDWFLKLEIIKKIFGFSILFVSIFGGIKVYCYGLVVNAIFDVFINTKYSGRLIKMNRMSQMKDLLPSFLLACIAGIFTHIVIMNFNSSVAQLLVGFPFYLITYLGVAKLLKLNELNDFIYLISFHFKK